jgi:hypothetical protein
MRFTIRDLLWLTLLAAVAVAWWVDRRALSRRIETAKLAAVIRELAREVSRHHVGPPLPVSESPP